MGYIVSYKQYGTHAILIEWPSLIDENVLTDVLQFKEKIKNHYIEFKVEVNHAYHSILMNYEFYDFEFNDEVKVLKTIYSSVDSRSNITSKLWKIPVCYDETFGLDLIELSSAKDQSINELIERHTNQIYTVYFTGFLPGFLYLGGLDETLCMPRRSMPRLHVAKGAVAIGGKQTGVYPIESPGGWHIIGNTPINFFDVSRVEPCFAKAGDKIQFYPINLKAYKDIKTLAEAKVYQLESEVIDD